MASPRLIATLTLAGGVLAGCGAPSTSAGAVPTATAPVIRTDIVARQQLPGSLTYAGSYTVINETGPGVFTALPAPGTIVNRGQVLYWVDGRPIPLFYGDPEWRRLSVGVADGVDIKALQANLVVLGFGVGLRIDNHFDWVTAAAVRRWQASLGQVQTGVVNIGDAVYVPGLLRVTTVHASPGMLAQPGQPVVEGTSADRVVLLPLDVSRASLLRVGDAVTVLLTDGTTTAAGTVTTIGSVALAQNSGNGGQNGPPPTPMVTVTITLADPAEGSLDQAPVSVGIAYDTHKSVLAVPVMALLAQPGGTYAVEVVEGSQRRSVTVATGLFDDRGLVEVSSPELRQGMFVEVPRT